MPIFQRPISSSYSYGSERIYGHRKGNDVIEDASFSAMVGCLRQLQDLVINSTDIFNEIITLTTSVENRIQNLSQRAKTLQIDIETIKVLPLAEQTDSLFQENGHRSERLQILQYPQTAHLMDSANMPLIMNARYQSAKTHKNPDFNLLEAYRQYFPTLTDKIIYRYSNPNYFFDQWLLVQEQRLKFLAAEREQLRKDKKV